MRKHTILLYPFLICLVSCNEKMENEATTSATKAIEGTWKLLTGTLIEKGDTTITDYTKDKSFIKIINDSHFAFLQHDLKRDSASGFSAGGGRYELNGNKYTEHL